jgi:hypothetical protein
MARAVPASEELRQSDSQRALWPFLCGAGILGFGHQQKTTGCSTNCPILTSFHTPNPLRYQESWHFFRQPLVRPLTRSAVFRYSARHPKEDSHEGARQWSQSLEHEVHQSRHPTGDPSGGRPAPEAEPGQEDHHHSLPGASADAEQSESLSFLP